MEQMLLSPDIAVNQTAKGQSVTANTTENNEERFDPFLDEAVNSQNNIKKTQQESGSSTEDNQEENTEQIVSSDNIDPARQSQTAGQLSTVQENAQNAPLKTAVAVDTLQVNTPAQNGTVSLSLLTDNAEANLLSTNSQSGEIYKAEANLLSTNSQSGETGKAEANLLSTNSQSGETGKAETILLQQIQQIIDEGKNIGAIAIKGSSVSDKDGTEQGKNLQGLSSMVLDDTAEEAIQVRQTNTLQMLSDEQKTPGPDNAPTSSESNRQEITEQFLNAKFGETKNDGEQQAASQQDKQKGSNGQHKPNDMGVTIAATPAVTDTDTSELGFTQQLRATDISTNTSNPPIEGKFAPGAHQSAIPERELVDNLIQRFNINPRLQTSKLTMQLHPAELGQIKIDIFVKGDSISANIVANSQQVVETMDKNVHRLRAVLEEQGFTVDSFQITMDDNSGKQSELFQEQFNSRQQDSAFTKSSSRNSETFDNILDLQGDHLDTPTDDNSVNVTI